MRRALVLALLLATAGCSLPLPQDVQSVRAAPAPRRQDGDIQVLPPGPKDGQTPEEIVQGFLGAQANPDDHHAIARQFLTSAAAATWADEALVQVYDPARLDVQQVSGTDPPNVEVTSVVSAQVRADGSYVARVPETARERYSLLKVKGQWRLAEVPAGLRLTSADRERSYQPSNVYYLAPAVRDTPPHLAPDLVFLPVGGDPVATLVRRLLAGPSVALGSSVTSAFPPGLRTRSVSMIGTGVVTVDLDATLVDVPPAARQALSAQLVWTLRGLGPVFTGLHLLAAGRPLQVPTEGQVQDAGDWNDYDPEGLGPNPPYFFVANRRLRSSVTLPSGPATTGDVHEPNAVPVDAAAVTRDRTQVALLDGVAPGPVTVRTGPLRGPTYTTGPTAPGLSSPSWGSGQYGLWLLQQGRRVVLLPNGARSLRTVAVVGLPGGRLQSLALSRDGVRAALVVSGQLYVGRVVVVAGSPRVVGLRVVHPGLQRVSKVAWASGIELAVLGALTRNDQVLRVAVDGSSVVSLNSSGLSPVAVAASPAGLLVASGGGVYVAVGRGFGRVQTGEFPAFPG